MKTNIYLCIEREKFTQNVLGENMSMVIDENKLWPSRVCDIKN